MDFNTLIDDIEGLVGKELQSIQRGSEIVVDNVDHDAESIVLHTVSGRPGRRSFSEITRLWNALRKQTAVHVDSALGGSGSSRNQPETILANLPYVEWLKLDGKKHIVYVGNNTHELGTLKEMSEQEYMATQHSIEMQRIADLVNLPRNLIFFGAPGTGKSYQLNKIGVRAKDNPDGIFPKEQVRRVTFYPDYTYSQFVGSYRPFTEGDKIGYRYIPGPFLETYIDATLHPYKNYLLIIEELNRANPAAVFGDVFQLLDRDAFGASEYYVSVPMEMSACIKASLDKLDESEQSDIESFFDPDMDFKEFCDSTLEYLTLPPNMYIWATMNSADQGVFPMDTAFKRRWDFRYIGIDEGEGATPTALGGKRLDEHTVGVGGARIVWNELRKAINMLLLDVGVNEDKLLGPFFLSPEALNDEPYGDDGKSRFVGAFEDKVLLYLYEDAGKMKRRSIFRDGNATFAGICDEFEDRGIEVFLQSTELHRDIFADVYATSDTVATSVPTEEG